MPDLTLIFWAATALLAYTYVGYPALLWILARWSPQSFSEADETPTVTVLVVAHNEASRIEARIQNLLELDYPPERMDIIVASDGSTDATVERAKRFSNYGVRVIAFDSRRGKPSVLNALVPKARGKIVLLADARQRFHPGALRALARRFADSNVGAVSGELLLTRGDRQSGVGEGVGFYWRYEKFIRRCESRVDSTVGATGAIYAIRRELFEPIPEDTLVDDVLIPMRIVRRGYRVVFESRARAFDQVSATSDAELRRKVRTLCGNFQLFFRELWLVNPLQNRIWLQTLSHKGLRLLGPFLLATVFCANLSLLDHAFYVATLAAQIAFYAAAIGGLMLRNASAKLSVLNVPYTFCLLNAAALIALMRFLAGRQHVTWDKAGG